MRAQGHTLVELLLVVMILGIMAAVAIPDLAAPDPDRLNYAAKELTGALRFARGEAIRTGVAHGVNIATTENRFRVFRYDQSVATPVQDYSVYHPLDKKLYDITLTTATMLAGISITKADFYSGFTKYSGAVLFDSMGTPFMMGGSTVKVLTYGTVELAQDKRLQTVFIQPVTGRISSS